MKKELMYLAAASMFAYFEGEGDPAGDPPAGDPPAGKTFTQEEVNSLLAKNKRSLQDELTKTKEQLVALQSSSSLNDDEKASLTSQIESLNNMLMTKEELAKREHEKLKKDADKKVSDLTAQAELWKKRHDDMLIENQLISAVSLEGQKAYNPRQIVDLFKSRASVVEADGKFSVSLKVDLPDSAGVLKTLDLEPTAAMKELAALPEYANLFNIDTKTGLGRTKQKFSPQRGQLPTSMKDYKANRPDLVG